MSRYLLTVEYDGTDYCGWQRQKNGVSVQEVLEDALSRATGEKTVCVASGRTDSGVHALGQAVHCDLSTPIPEDKIPFAVNYYLPESVRIRRAEKVSDEFSARFGAKRKTYEYRMYIANISSPTRDRYALRVIPPLDVDAMKEAAESLLGEHDFRCFLASGSQVKTTVRTIYSASIVQNGDELTFTVEGNGFLYNMVRIITGTLIYVGKGKLKASDVAEIIESRDRKRAGKTVPPNGLFLKSVVY